MEPFARTLIGYHGCTEAFARELLVGTKAIADWQPSTNEWDWLGHGIYFWEHSPERALRWAQEKLASGGAAPAVLGAVVQLGRCFDLLNEAITALLASGYQNLAQGYAEQGLALPVNRGPEGKRRELDCVVLNNCLSRLRETGLIFDTVRGAFLEGDPVYPGAGIRRETHLQIAVRNPDCILGVFRPNLKK
jgi:hypothetical protein